MSTQPASDEAVPQAQRYRWPVITWIALLALAVGLGIVFFGASERVTSVRVKSTGLVIPNMNDMPDYFVVLVLKDDTRVETPAYADVPIGGGLSFELPEPVRLSSVAQVVLYDKDMFSSDMLDRADIDGPICSGQSHSFEFRGPRSQIVTAGIVIAALGGLCLAYVVIAFIRAHAL